MLRPCRSAYGGGDFLGFALHEEPAEKFRRAALGGNRRAVARVAERLSLGRHREHERRMARQISDLFGSELIERNVVPETAAIRMRRAGDEASLGLVAARDARQTHAGKDGHLRAVRGQFFEIRRERKIAPCFFRKEKLWHDALVRLDANHAPGHGGIRARGLCRCAENRAHRVEKRQREGDACAAEKGASAERGLGDVGHGRWM